MTSPHPTEKPLRVAALIDLPLSPLSGGHARGWENLAKAAAATDLPLDFTAYFSGDTSMVELSAKARIKRLPPVFSTSRLKFLLYVPDNTDLGRYHKELAKELESYDIIVTTDGFFCFAQTAEKVSRKRGIPLITSFHTDTPAYARIFTRLTIEKLFGKSWLSSFLLNGMRLPEKQEAAKMKRLTHHLRACSAAFYKRDEDKKTAAAILGEENVHGVRIGTDRSLFGPHRRDRAGVEMDYDVPHDSIIVLFVGRLDEGKNIYTLIGAMENLIAEGRAIHLITAGVGPADQDLRERLGDHVTVAGQVSPEEIARLYASVDVFALPSEVEIRNTASVEAIVSGLPILVSEKSGIAALCDNTPAMLVVPSGVEAWTKTLRDVTGSTNTRLHMAKVARAYADTSIARWQDVLENDFYPVWKKAMKEKKHHG